MNSGKVRVILSYDNHDIAVTMVVVGLFLGMDIVFNLCVYKLLGFVAARMVIAVMVI